MNEIVLGAAGLEHCTTNVFILFYFYFFNFSFFLSCFFVSCSGKISDILKSGCVMHSHVKGLIFVGTKYSLSIFYIFRHKRFVTKQVQVFHYVCPFCKLGYPLKASHLRHIYLLCEKNYRQMQCNQNILNEYRQEPCQSIFHRKLNSHLMGAC